MATAAGKAREVFTRLEAAGDAPVLLIRCMEHYPVCYCARAEKQQISREETKSHKYSVSSSAALIGLTCKRVFE